MNLVINRKTLIGMLFTGLTLLGYISYQNLPVELFPNATAPMLIVQVTSPIEVDPGYMERQAVIPIEGAVGTLEDVEEISSQSQQRRGMVYISYQQDVDLKYAELKLQDRIQQVQDNLPEGFMTTVTRVDLELGTNQVMSIQVLGEGGVNRVRNLTDKEIAPKLENIDGVAGVEVFGGQEKSLQLTLDEDALEAYGLTPFMVRNAITQNGREKTFVGQVYEGGRKLFVHVSAEYFELSEIENLVVSREGPILLGDVAEVYFGVKDQTSYSRVNGLDAVTMSLIGDSQTNMIDLSHAVREEVDRLNKELKPIKVEMAVQEDTAEMMEDNINQIINLALIGGLLAIFVLWIFLRNLRIVFTIALAMPLSIFTAFNVFYATGISINSLTLVGLVLAIGMLLDNSIVVLENIYRWASSGEKIATAVVQGTREVRRAIVAATLTTIMVFVPLLFSEEFFIKIMGDHIGISIISTLLISLFVALFFVPMATHFFMQRRGRKRPMIFESVSLHNRLIQTYVLLLKTSMRNPAWTIIGGLFLFFLTIFISLAISTNTSQEAETSDIRLSVTMPGGSTLETTDLTVRTIEDRLMNIEEKDNITTEVREEEASITIHLLDDYQDINGRGLPEVKSDIDRRLEDIHTAEIEFQTFSASSGFGGGGGGGPGNRSGGGGFESFMGIGAQQEQVLIKGQDFELMKSVAEDMQYYLEELTSIASVSLSVASNRPEVHMEFSKRELAERDVPLTSISSELSSFPSEITSGAVFKEGTEEYDIIIKMDIPEEEEDEDERNMQELKELDIPSQTGANYELQELSNVFFSRGISAIDRVNQEKEIDITYRFDNEVNNAKSLLDAARLEVDELVAGMTIPAGVAVQVVHEENQFDDFYYLIGAAFILIFMILAAVFESLWIPFVLLFTIPLAGIGAFTALIFTGSSLLNANTLLGFIILIGLVVNNGIILIDFTNILRKGGYRRSRALISAGLARIRPILMTAVTTMVALLPLAMGNAEYVSLIGAPFAISVIGGLSVSTLLTLIFIPTLYTALENSLSWINSLKWYLKLAMFLIAVGLGIYVFTSVETFLWKLIDTILLIVGIPAITWFLMNSLKKAGTKLIAAEDTISIRIRSLVKIYDRDNRFTRELNGGKAIRERTVKPKTYRKLQDFSELIWQIPLIGFLFYFVYFYMESGFWFFILNLVIYFIVLGIWSPIGNYISKRSGAGKRIARFVYLLILWGFPVFTLSLIQIRWGNIALEILIGLIWLFALVVFASAKHIKREHININRIKGRFGLLRRGFYRMVQSIPLIGRQKKPFKALAGVSLEITEGMIGLLGPNGAGKTTMMRIICGILEQSHGKIWINGIDTQEKREELQGLIGYLPQEFGMYENMTAGEYLHYQGILKGVKDPVIRKERVDYVLKSVHMDTHKNEKIGSFSGGMKQRIGIAQILLHLPRILVVDEPTAGLDPRERIRFRNLLVELSRQRVVIFSTHIIEDISSSCNQVAVLNKGELKYYGVPQEMADFAEGHVWQVEVGVQDFDELTEKFKVVHHMRDGQKIRARFLAESKPMEDAIPVRPLLEDSYLWMLGKKVEEKV